MWILLNNYQFYVFMKNRSIKKQTGEVTGTLPKKRQKDENYQGYI